MYKAREVIEVLGLDCLEEGELAIFCGAGVSIHSGIPAAWSIISSLLQAMRVGSDDSKAVIESDIPFELLMEIFDNNSDISPLFKMFQLGRPNANHHLIANLARLGLVKTIVTTNFDPHIENALAAEGVYCRVLSEESEFGEIDNLSHSTVVVKLHGTVDKPESIRTTLRDVANNNLSERRRAVIKSIFSSGSHKKVLVLGYSCSDTDLVPQIQSIEGLKKEIIYLKHEQKDEFEVLNLGDEAATHMLPASSTLEGKILFKITSAFGNYPNIMVKGSTDIFVGELASANSIPLPRIDCCSDRTRFQSSVDSWAEPLSERGLDLFIAGLIFSEICEYDRAMEYLERSLDARHARGENGDVANCLGNIANVCRAVGNFDKAMEYHEMARSIFHQIGDEYGESGCYLNMGNVFNEKGRFPEAFDCHEKALSAFRNYGDLASMATCYLGHGDTYRLQSQSSEALKYYKEALKIKQDIGDVMGVATCHGNLGTTYGVMDNLAESEKEYGIARGLYESIGYWKGISNSDIGLANTLISTGRAKETIKLCEPILSKNEQIGDREGIATCHATIGAAYYALGNLNQAIDHLELASREFNATGQKEYERRANSLLTELLQFHPLPRHAFLRSMAAKR